ncbi:ABC transporter permease [Bowmanella sp. JS7-9]|uniref:ABC transporter permease n=1 Tax=Pseudobowmanella zhangzhouensis TaxID=1537679 RepID=A0ABW1XK59_9ALTE|nr:ABC transporter permease [Bowmanella sp. JS7-9]TBX22129.1 sodium ABC transporter permease [Bowmanella sp. JS7-9]
MWMIFRKEWKELLRDRKTLFFMIALPMLLFPLIFGAIIFFTANAVKDAESKVLNYAIVGAEYSTQISQALADAPDKFKRIEIDANADYAVLIKDKTVDFILVIPAEFGTNVLDNGPQKIALYLNDAGLNMVYRRVNEIVSDLSDQVQQDSFARLGLSETQQQGLLEPVSLERKNVADERENWGEKIGGMLPYMIFILCLQGAMAPAADLGAGEKERGTLETLLISPMERYKLVMGKFLTIGFAGVTSALITVASLALWGLVLSQGLAIAKVAAFMAMIGWIDFVLIFLMLIPVVAIFAAVLLSLSIYARSFKEAQSYMGSLIIFVLLPVIIALTPGVKLEGHWVWVPLTNVALAMKELVKGTMDYFALIGIFTSTAVIAVALIAFCIHWFNKEKVLFR